jgi:DNA-binding transcriptional regulator YhcF (GntR family)
MLVQIDFDSDEAIYQQLCNQIILGIACSQFQDGDNLPSVRELADDIGINMHTVNKAYTILKQEGYLTLDRRRGAVIAVNADKYNASQKLMDEMKKIIAQAICKGIDREEIHQMVDQIFFEIIAENGGRDE